MDDELEKQLVGNHPEIFSFYGEAEDFEGPKPQLALFGFECGDGWFDLIDTLCETIKRLNVKTKAVQVKEKFGELRFYHDGLKSDEKQKPKIASGAIRMAENMSLNICEICGDSAELHQQNGWYKVRCDDCLKKEQE